MADPEIYNASDKELGAMLHRLFSQGHDEVVLQHPVDGEHIVTKEEFYKQVGEIAKYQQMSPAARLQEKKRLERVALNHQIKFRTALLEAPVALVNMEDDKFGYDKDGQKLDIEGLVFIHTRDYPDEVELVDNEVGCFFDEQHQRDTIRIAQWFAESNSPAGGGASNTSR